MGAIVIVISTTVNPFRTPSGYKYIMMMTTIIDMAPVNVRSIELKGWLDQATLEAQSKQRFPMISGFSMGNYKQGKVQGL